MMIAVSCIGMIVLLVNGYAHFPLFFNFKTVGLGLMSVVFSEYIYIILFREPNQRVYYRRLLGQYKERVPYNTTPPFSQYCYDC